MKIKTHIDQIKKVNCYITINDTNINNLSVMKALGVYLDENLTWEHHVKNLSKSCDKISMGFNILKKYFTLSELITLVTSLFYSKMYYASEVWLSTNLTIQSQKLLMSMSSKILKTISGIKCNQEDGISYVDLHRKLNRATPLMMSSYIQLTCLHRILTTSTPNNVFLDLIAHHYDATRHYKPTFIKDNRSRAGMNVFRNRIQKATNQIQEDMTLLTFNQLKVLAKREFLTF